LRFKVLLSIPSEQSGRVVHQHWAFVVRQLATIGTTDGWLTQDRSGSVALGKTGRAQNQQVSCLIHHVDASVHPVIAHWVLALHGTHLFDTYDGEQGCLGCGGSGIRVMLVFRHGG